jgi:hypothetical protein
MTLDKTTIAALAARLEAAEHQRAPLTKITDEYPGLDWDDAYAIQDAIRASKLGCRRAYRRPEMRAHFAGQDEADERHRAGVRLPV